jgi:hypothetical protein
MSCLSCTAQPKEKPAGVTGASPTSTTQSAARLRENGRDRVSTVAKQNSVPSADDIGLSRQDIHEARIIRDAEKADADIVRTQYGFVNC